MEYLPIIFIGAIFLCLLLLLRRKPKETHQKPQPQIISEYDSDGYNRHGYNEVGRNRQGKYNRYYNVKCYKTGLYSDEGFLDIRKNPLYLTNHARERMYERMGINDSQRMNELAFEAYQFGKSKHPYLVIAISGGGSNVYGWVDASQIEGAPSATSTPSVETFNKGDRVKIKSSTTRWVDGASIPSWVKNSQLYICGFRNSDPCVTINSDLSGVTGVLKTSDLYHN